MVSLSHADGGHEEDTAPRSTTPYWGQTQDSETRSGRTAPLAYWTRGMECGEIDEDSESIGTPYGSPVNCRAVSDSRPYTSGFDPPLFRSEQSGTSELSIITDAGDQQHQEHLALPSTGTSLDDLDDDEASDLDEQYDPKHRLQSTILEALEARTVNGTGDTARFLPKSKLYYLVNPDTVKRELEESLPSYSLDTIDRYAKSVCKAEKVALGPGRYKLKSYRKIFALLVLAGLSETIVDFVNEDISDLCLPLMSTGKAGKPVLRRMDSRGQPFGPERLRCFRRSKWRPMDLLHFVDHQWIFLAPYFSQSADDRAKHYVLQPRHILPFTSSETPEDDTEHYGGFAKVFTVRIHEDHHDFPDQILCNRGFAIKQLTTTDRNVFKKEVKILKKFSGAHSHPHVVSLLATYEQANTFYLIFYKAEGDLFSYWRSLHRTPILNHKNVLWILKQWIGITEGLTRLHRHMTLTFKESATHEEKTVYVNAAIPHSKRPRSDSVQSNGAIMMPDSPTWADTALAWQSGALERPSHGELIQEQKFGRHGDISPGNILWYDNDDRSDGILRGTLKLSDFGEAEMNSRFSRTRKRDIATTMTYRAPECDFPPKDIRQSYDIWSLGCVFLEFVTWMLRGAAGLDAFAEERLSRDPFPPHDNNDIFFEAESNPETGDIKPKVKQKVIDFIYTLHENPQCSEYLHDVLDLIENNMLLVDDVQRFSCMKVLHKLENMFQKCSTDHDYATVGQPWCVYKRTTEHNTALRRNEATSTTSKRHLLAKDIALRGTERSASASRLPRSPNVRSIDEMV